MHDRQAKFDDQTLTKCESRPAVQQKQRETVLFYTEQMGKICLKSFLSVVWYLHGTPAH